MNKGGDDVGTNDNGGNDIGENDVGTNDNGGNDVGENDVGGNDPSAGEGVDKPTQTKKNKGKKTPKKAPKKAQPKPKSIVNLPPSPVSPKTAFESLTSHHSVFLRKIPKITAKRKGLSTTSQPFEVDHETEGNNHTENEVVMWDEDYSEGKKVDEPSAGSKNVKRKVDFGDEYVSEDDSDGGIMGHDYVSEGCGFEKLFEVFKLTKTNYLASVHFGAAGNPVSATWPDNLGIFKLLVSVKPSEELKEDKSITSTCAENKEVFYTEKKTQRQMGLLLPWDAFTFAS
ncbi:hypothetical protein POM88_008944 [Heracleum sosnowskyi]|uniref:Uncharacterized protein n=1 Tax=Heracleum sosnowskyi TaxID=360622 RepID=A0AAD8J8F0_9APIA|nr:hypothetical protein POM88_008944 [Heracleum sosnowskyi]